ncbi:MAG TPA: hypothetical protein VMC86_03945 [Gemmatimonadales bacterium]|nr:hypothetical protein [Gemmatimonadales bacterium]
MSDLHARLQTALGDRYAVHSELGNGGLATVFLADDLRHSRQVAVKVLQEGEALVADFGIAMAARSTTMPGA